MPVIGERLRELREQKGLSQADIEEKTGILRCYISRVENSHTIPSLETLIRLAGALDVPLYQVFYFGDEPAPTPHLTARKSLEELAEEGNNDGAEARFLLKIRGMASQIAEPNREVFLRLARRLAMGESANS